MKLIDGIRSFYDNYVARLRIGTKLTAPYFVTTGTIIFYLHFLIFDERCRIYNYFTNRL